MSQANGFVALRRAYWLPRSLLATYLIAAGCQSPGVVQDSPGDRVQRERARELIRGIEEEVQIFEIRPLQDPTAIPPERPQPSILVWCYSLSWTKAFLGDIARDELL